MAPSPPGPRSNASSLHGAPTRQARPMRPCSCLGRSLRIDSWPRRARPTPGRARRLFERRRSWGAMRSFAGDTSAAAQLYRRILELDGNGIIARRLLLMLWREARIQEAAELAPRVVLSDGNLAQHLRGSDAVNDLARRLGCESRREATTASGQNARDVGLPDRCAARTLDDLEQAYR